MAALRRPSALAAAAATVVAIGATALTLPAIAADGAAPKAAPIELEDGTLDWGLKESFRKYVTGIAGGEITATDGAEQAADNGIFTFSDGTGTYDTGTHAVETAFKGKVSFVSKLHGFDIGITDVKVSTEGTGGAIEADVTLNGETQNDIALAELDLTDVKPGQGEGGAMTFEDIPATLTADGAKAFNGMYEEGTELDPATLTVTAGDPSGEPGPDPTDDPGDPTGDPTDGPTTDPTGDPTSDPTGKPTTEPTGDASDAPAGDAVDGTLTWGLKESFRKYISTGGEVKTAGGAKKAGDDGYTFPYEEAEVDAEAKTVDASFGGSVQFLYKAHGIDMKFGDIRVEAQGAKGTVVLDVTTPEGTNDDVEFATLDLSKASYAVKDDVLHLKKVPAAFTADGAEQFANETTGSMYKEGDPIDPVDVALALSEDAELPGGGSGGSGGGSGSGGAGTTGGAGT
ncbi:hypothetical protein DY218_13250, partial [Streptomyces triticagri]